MDRVLDGKMKSNKDSYASAPAATGNRAFLLFCLFGFSLSKLYLFAFPSIFVSIIFNICFAGPASG